MGFEFGEFTRYRNNFTQMTRLFDRWLTSFLLGQGMQFLASVKPLTPVDTGDLRNQWRLDGVTRKGDTLQCWFMNSMYYATFVEYGHAKPYKSGAVEGSPDWVDGFFMMTISLDEVERNLPSEFESAFTQFLMNMEII